MKKYFKLGTALAFSVLLNLSPTVMQNVHAEDANPKEEIVEKVDVNQTNTINDVLNNNSTIEVEEPIVSEKITKESTSATANNVLESAPARAPNVTVEEQNEVNQNKNTDNNIIETDEIKDSDETSEKKTGKVIVRYIDELGIDIFDAITIDGNVGDSYITEKKVIDGYTYTSVEGEEKSNITEETTYVIYTYKKSESPVLENIIKNNTKNLTEDNIQKDTKGVLSEEGNEQLGEQNRDSDSSQTPASAAATITDNSFTITATPTKLDTREDTIHYNLNYSFKVTNYNGNLAIRITDSLPYTSGNYKASVTEDTINALNATIGTSYTNYNQLIWENNLGEVNTYDEEGVTFTGEIPFDLAFTGIPYTVNSFTNRITPYVISYYSTDGTTIKEGSKAISSQKSNTFTVPVANEETKSLTITGPNEINSLDELVTYTINYNFDITNTNASAVLTITDTLPITIDEENENNYLAGGTHTDGSKSIVWKINVPEKERCVDGVCTPENISGSIVFKVAYNLASLNNNLNIKLVYHLLVQLVVFQIKVFLQKLQFQQLSL